MQKLKVIDYITSLVAALLWMLGGYTLFALIAFTAKHTLAGSGYGKEPKGAPIYTFVGLFVYAGLIIGAWLAAKWLLPLFMRITKQKNIRQTVHKFIMFSWFSIFSLFLSDFMAKDDLVVGYGLWVITLATIYLAVRSRSEVK